MNQDGIKRLLKQKESIHLEFKEATTALPGNLFETICAMPIDNGKVPGVDENAAAKMITDLVNLSNNPKKLVFSPQVYDINGRKIIQILNIIGSRGGRDF